MVFSSPIFLFAFLPLFLIAYYLTPFRGKSYVILGASYVFYAWWRIDYLMLFIALTAWNYSLGLQIAKREKEESKKWLTLGVVSNLATLCYFKYTNFGISNLNAILEWAGTQPLPLADIILPIGISFYLFHCISYLVDIYRRDAAPVTRFVDFAAFISLYPQLVAGPILRYKDLAHQFRHRVHDWTLFSHGVMRFIQGFVKKVLIADSLAPVVDMCFASSNPGLLDSWLGALAFTAQLYFDFSGYSSMAVGLGCMMGFRFTENFNMPFMSQSFSEFWRRWHISLSSWLRDYVYIPLGGNNAGIRKTYRNLSITMLLSGIWHGAAWTFVVIGAFYAVILCIERASGVSNRRDPGLRGVVRTIVCMTITVFVLAMFRAPSVPDGISLYAGMLGLNGWTGDGVHLFYPGFSLLMVAVAYVTIYVIEPLYIGRPQFTPITPWHQRADVAYLLVALPLFGLAISRLLAQSYSPFLYFAF
ncbi:MAG: rane bound O-acyl transferase, family protein [Moraxellaceae bacterium]|jgi:alginate O-acetyltransferase complex protein AlgI|nr:rane bound O-acyl transferase, family protein [Moraxellaceae bacterium]